jgi:guanylate kinase
MSVSLTTRLPREGEQAGVDYEFVSLAAFEQQRAAGQLSEWAQVFDAWYGTPRGPLERAVSGGHDILLDIDIQGAQQLRERYPEDAVSVFVLPPSFADLERRLRGRGTEDEAAIGRRLERARAEAQAYSDYDYLIINDSVEDSLTALKAIIAAERLRIRRLREGFAPWKK